MSSQVSAHLLKNPVHFLALGLGSGLSPKAPGTAGTLAALPLIWLCAPTDSLIYLAITLAISLLGIWICDYSAYKMGVHDHPAIVWDEFAGIFITFLLVPATGLNLVAGFVLFRFFDIVKPWPIRWLDRHVDGGLGIMLDDILAGIFALLCMHGLLWAGWL
ncbi:Phosphatidylglycerophosphatase [Saliniradius amylolyticus]|uniref:Phosphatidylglycerophosphatase A n=1 Tax=Saliniradius amylolyticus TaxID=2183582 RepID=A0A2S2E1C3_9ALTE|nr:phosphatidylglycerophosphatase A [Saliniradius amylolyticus]AWL11426.1 Phosphatidylglycerophosphatase [Saliniradius amylolyticus]